MIHCGLSGLTGPSIQMAYAGDLRRDEWVGVDVFFSRVMERVRKAQESDQRAINSVNQAERNAYV